ncbi:MAG TPA: EAL domain-containing protein [Pseudolabrys sp.]|nr:EAL domain-containing protein [Pseudolabrys sp.]
MSLVERHPWDVGIAVVIFAVTCAIACLLTFAFGGRARREAREQHHRFEAALNNMKQGLCMFDAQDRVVIWNQRYLDMYDIKPDQIWSGCNLDELLEMRRANGNFTGDVWEYIQGIHAALSQGGSFTKITELADGRSIALVNQSIPGGGWVATHEDITERTKAERELARTRVFLDVVVSNVPTPIVVKDAKTLHYLLVNKAAEKFFGIDAAEVVGKTALEVFEPEVGQDIQTRDLAMLKTGKEAFYDEHETMTPTGEARIVTTTRLPVAMDSSEPRYIISVLHDVTERKRDEARITYMSHHDAMTDLPNRVSFNECLNGMLDLAKKDGASFAVLCLDIDRLKTINETFGSVTGDGLLKQLAGRLQEACEGAFLARVGGDEFCVVSPTGQQPAVADALAARLREATAADFDVNGHVINISMTIGIALYPSDADDVTGLLANAEAALYRAKTDNRGGVLFFEPEMDKQLREKRALQHDLKQALHSNELELFYQPQADMAGNIVGFEALVRWHHPRQGMVPPSSFIPLAEESGLIMPLGQWILRAACKEAASWPKPLRIAVNLSPVQFQHGELANQIHETLLETGLPSNRLEIEITEGVLIGDFSRAMATLRRIKNMGVRIAMDDFGTGYSSLSYLQSFPFDKIKIDQVFIANLLNSPQSAAIVRAVIGLGHGLQLPVIAEGVETKEQLEILAHAGCDGVQGYLIGRPLPIDEYATTVGRPGRLRLVKEAG